MEPEFLKLMIGTDKIPERCIICAGTTKEEWIENILPIFDSAEKIACRSLGCFYLVKHKGKSILLAFNVLGSPVSMSLTEILTQNGAKKIIFIGWAGGYKNDIGEFVIPNRTYCADGITSMIKTGVEFAYPDETLSGNIKKYLDKKGVKYSEGDTLCIIYPDEKIVSTFEKKLKGFKPLATEMELAPYFFASGRNRVPAAAMLIISDAKGKSAVTKENQNARVESQKRAIKYAAEILTERP